MRVELAQTKAERIILEELGRRGAQEPDEQATLVSDFGLHYRYRSARYPQTSGPSIREANSAEPHA
jgi:hypothetical protein